MIKIKKISLVLGLLTSSVFLCNAGIANSDNPDGDSSTFTPDHNYVMITFDDSYGRSGVKGSAFKQVQQLLVAGAQMTYFATAAFTGDFSTFDDWVNKYKCEAANHTVTHIRGGGDLSVAPVDSPDNWSDAKIAYTTKRWKNEMKDMDSILNIWSNIDSKKITGFRAPQLLLNVYAFDGFASYIKEKGYQDVNYYDSTITYPAGGVSVSEPGDLEPPKELTSENYCNNKKFNLHPTYLGTDLDQCKQLMSYYGVEKDIQEPIWEIPIPILPGAKFAMTLPKCSDLFNCKTPDVFQNFIADWILKSKTPLLISIHSDELLRPGKDWFIGWVKKHIHSGNIHFVTVQSVIDMYATPQDNILDNQQVSVSQAYESGSYNNCSVGDTGYASSSPDPDGSKFGVFPYCNLDCTDTTSYGENCYKYGNTPGKTGKFITNNSSCTPTGELPSGFTPGAYPWLGNPMGNQTIGTTCNYFPDKAKKPTPASTPCTNRPPSAYSEWSEGSQNVDGFCVSYSGDVPPGTVPTGIFQCVTDQSAHCVGSGPAIATIPSYWKPHPDTPTP